MKQGILSVAGNIQSFWIFSQLSYFFVRLCGEAVLPFTSFWDVFYKVLFKLYAVDELPVAEKHQLMVLFISLSIYIFEFWIHSDMSSFVLHCLANKL
jgi:hypothetical protein